MVGQKIKKILSENFDIMDTETRKVLVAIDESDQNLVLASLCAKLYDKIVEKVDDIDYGDIPNTKGDITKLSNYDKLVESIEIIQSLLKEFKQDTGSIDIVDSALKNIKDRKELFEKGFRYNTELPIVVYSTISLSIISSVSFLISTCIEFIKEPNNETFDVVIDKVSLAKSRENLLFRNLEKFNRACDNKQIDQGLEFAIKNASGGKGLLGAETGVILGGIALVAIATSIIPITRELIFFFYYTRTRVSDYFDIQADLLQMNAYNVQSSKEMKKEQRDKIAKKQFKIVELFRKIANTLSVEVKGAELSAEKEIQGETKKYKTSEVLKSLPDSAASSLF